MHTLYNQLVLGVQIYSHGEGNENLELQHIPQSPFYIDLRAQNEGSYCMQFDVITGGFGYQKTSQIVEQPA